MTLAQKGHFGPIAEAGVGEIPGSVPGVIGLADCTMMRCCWRVACHARKGLVAVELVEVELWVRVVYFRGKGTERFRLLPKRIE